MSFPWQGGGHPTAQTQKSVHPSVLCMGELKAREGKRLGSLLPKNAAFQMTEHFCAHFPVPNPPPPTITQVLVSPSSWLQAHSHPTHPPQDRPTSMPCGPLAPHPSSWEQNPTSRLTSLGLVQGSSWLAALGNLICKGGKGCTGEFPRPVPETRTPRELKHPHPQPQVLEFVGGRKQHV